jgi:hypothetical protein
MIDFRNQPLLPHMHSLNGPGLSAGDVMMTVWMIFLSVEMPGQQGHLYLSKKIKLFVDQIGLKIPNMKIWEVFFLTQTLTEILI